MEFIVEGTQRMKDESDCSSPGEKRTSLKHQNRTPLTNTKT